MSNGTGATGAVEFIAGKELDYTSAANADAYFALQVYQNNSYSERLRITSAGNVGIGTTTPGAKLNIIGALCVDDTSPTCANAARTDGTIYAVATTITGIDVAEQYPTKDATLEAGDLVALDLNNSVFVAKSSTINSSPLIGAISTKPGIELGGFGVERFPGERKLPVALVGRVPVKVNLEGGAIQIGDRITSSSVAGVGMKATTSGQTVGIALEPYPNPNDTNGETNATNTPKILVFVNLGYSKLDSEIAAGESGGWIVDQATGRVKSSYALEVPAIFASSGLWSIDETGKLIAQEVETQKLTTQQFCVGATCITETEFQALLQNAGLIPAADTTPAPTSTSTPADTEPPVITILGNNPATIDVGASYADMGVTVTDNVDSNLGYTASLDGGPELSQGAGLTIDTSATSTHSIIYKAVDQAGNTATASRTVEVITAP